MFKIGTKYNRRKDIHGRFGGQMQGGISTPSNAPFIFLFTGTSGKNFGYADQWIDDIFAYVGEGQAGDMEFKAGNARIRDHRKNGKEIMLFRALGHGKPVEFLGQFVCASWEEGRGPDRNGDDRKIIIFHLAPSNSPIVLEGVDDIDDSPAESLKELRAKAIEAGSQPPKGGTKSAASNYILRSKTVKDYVLRRANGICEACKSAAPFTRKNGTPYLEPHHTKRLADSGPDHPRWVGAICPNCHREIHSGENGESLNQSLKNYLGTIEEED